MAGCGAGAAGQRQDHLSPARRDRTRSAGVTPDYVPVRNDTVTEGEFIQEQHLLGEASVALLGPETADKLFGRKDGLVGETIRIDGQPFRIIGVLTSKGGSGFGSQDDRILVPLTTAQTRLLRRAPPRPGGHDPRPGGQRPRQCRRPRRRSPRSCATATAPQVGADDFTVFTQQELPRHRHARSPAC